MTVQRTKIEVPYGNGGAVGFFVLEDAEKFEEAVHGQYGQSVNTDTVMDHQRVYRTAGGQWVVYVYSDHECVKPRHHFMDPGQARDWLRLNRHYTAADRYFDSDPEEAGPFFEHGRVVVHLGPLRGHVEEFAQRVYSNPARRADAVRTLVALGLEVVSEGA